MVAGENNHRVVALARFVEGLQNASKLVVDLGDHRIVPRLNRMGIVFLGRAHLVLKIAIGQLRLRRHVAFAKVRPGHGRGIKLLGIGTRRNEGRMRVVYVYVQHPRAFVRLANELNRPLGRPSGLVQFGGHAVVAFAQGIQIATLFANPIGVIVAFLPVVARGVAEFPIAEPVINPRLRAAARALQMKFSDQPAIIAGIGHQLTDHWRPVGKGGVAVARIVHAAGVQAGHEARPARRANRALAVGMRKCHAIAHKLIYHRRAYVRVAQRANGIEALLIGAVPENVGPFAHERATLRRCVRSGNVILAQQQHRRAD